jgi:hypothetical protein
MYVYVGMGDNDDNVFDNIWNEIKSCEAEERLSYEPLWYLFNTVRTLIKHTIIINPTTFIDIIITINIIIINPTTFIDIIIILITITF